MSCRSGRGGTHRCDLDRTKPLVSVEELVEEEVVADATVREQKPDSPLPPCRHLHLRQMKNENQSE